MSGMSLEPVQKAVYTALTGDTALAALVTGVYDRVPERTALPYLVFGNATTKDASTTTLDGETVRLELAVYSREGGRKQVLDILERVHAVLHQQALTLTGGWRVVWLRVERVNVDMLGDGMTWRGVAELNLLVEPDSTAARQNAKLVLLGIGNGSAPETFTAIGGLAITRLNIRRNFPGASHLGDGGWRPLHSGSGESSITIAGNGEFTDSVAEETLRAFAFSGAVANYQMDFGSGGIITAPCVVAAYERLADVREALTYRLTLESAGAGVYQVS